MSLVCRSFTGIFQRALHRRCRISELERADAAATHPLLGRACRELSFKSSCWDIECEDSQQFNAKKQRITDEFVILRTILTTFTRIVALELTIGLVDDDQFLTYLEVVAALHSLHDLQMLFLFLGIRDDIRPSPRTMDVLGRVCEAVTNMPSLQLLSLFQRYDRSVREIESPLPKYLVGKKPPAKLKVVRMDVVQPCFMTFLTNPVDDFELNGVSLSLDEYAFALQIGGAARQVAALAPCLQTLRTLYLQIRGDLTYLPGVQIGKALFHECKCLEKLVLSLDDTVGSDAVLKDLIYAIPKTAKHLHLHFNGIFSCNAHFLSTWREREEMLCNILPEDRLIGLEIEELTITMHLPVVASGVKGTSELEVPPLSPNPLPRLEKACRACRVHLQCKLMELPEAGFRARGGG